MDFGVGIENSIHQTVNAPDHVGLREINDEHPQRHEQEDGGELHAFGNGAENQRGSDDGEHQLVHGEHILRNPVGIIAIWTGINVVEKGEIKVPQKGVASMEYQAVTAYKPQNGDQAGDEEALGQN
jgi:hypothetical protein